MALAQTNRLRSPRDFSRVYGRGQFRASASFHLKLLSTKSSETRVAVVVSKKISKKSAVRNRIKRQTVEALRREWSKIQPGFDLIFIARTDISQMKPEQLELELRQLLEKAGVYA